MRFTWQPFTGRVDGRDFPQKKPDLKRSGFFSVTEVRICLSLICQFPGKTLQCRVEANRSCGGLSLSM